MNFKGKDCINLVLQHLHVHVAGMNECVDNFYKQRAEYLRRSIVVVCRESVAGIFYTGQVNVSRGG